jgi:hypothetical protein
MGIGLRNSFGVFYRLAIHYQFSIRMCTDMSYLNSNSG